jgi:Protein of unknown function (DUF4232)
MSDLERTLRDARASLPEPDPSATDGARGAVLAATPSPSRRARRLALGALVAAAALAGAFAAGLAVAPGGATTDADGPGFLPAQGWDTFQTGVTRPPQAPSATAANVRLGEDALSGTFPWETVARLHTGEVLLQATFYPAGEIAGIDSKFPRRSLPLSLDDAQTGATLEGQPANVTADRLVARVNGWNLDLFVFFGGRATTAARAAAQDELDRLVVPQGSPGPISSPPPVSRPSGTSCRSTALRARLFVQGATGTLLGQIRIRNVGRKACTLRGRPIVELRDANGVLLNARETAAAPIWKYNGAKHPPGWPTVHVAPRGVAQVSLQLANWCVVPVKPVYFHVRLPRAGEPIVARARVPLTCGDAHLPVRLAIGPVEPLR